MYIEPLGEIRIKYSLRRSVSASVDANGKITVKAPLWLPEKEIERFLRANTDKLLKYRQKQEQRNSPASAGELLTDDDINKLRAAAKKYIPARTTELADMVGVSYGRISIRCQKTRWGSCSSEGNLNFNCLLMLCPVEIVDYVIVHELCHRKEMNHSKRFWAEVESVLPDYSARRAWLKKNGGEIMKRAGK